MGCFANGDSLDELESLVILAGTPRLGSIKIRLLLNHFGSAREVLNAPIGEIEKLPGFGPKIASDWKTWERDKRWKEDLTLTEKHQVKIIPFTSGEYPKPLLEIHDFPIVLYVKGELTPQDKRSIAIVGTRQASIYGNELACTIAKDLALSGYTIVSGLARGIDTSAHQGALLTGRTLAVIGSGLANIYPRENFALAGKIQEKGAVISEFPMSTPPDRQNFPQRNRIVSGMTLGTLLIEAPLKSGAMITMELAQKQKRALFALPNRVDNENAKGNHQLIKSGRAHLVESADDVIAFFEQEKDLFGPVTKHSASAPSIPLSLEEENFLKMLPVEESSIETIVTLTKLPIMKLNVLLMSLVLKKVIKEFPGKIYKKILYAR